MQLDDVHTHSQGLESKPCREICETYGLCHVFLVGEANAEGVRPSRGVRGHDPPVTPPGMTPFGGEILQNSKDYKVHRRHKFSQTFLLGIK